MFKRTKKLLLVVLVLLMLTSGFVLNTEKINAAGLARETLEVRVEIASTHQFKLLTEPVVEFEYPWSGVEKGKALLIKNAVISKIASNATWNLAVNNQSMTEFTVLIKRNGTNSAVWKQLSNNTALFSGGNGRQQVSFDIKIKAPEAGEIPENGRKSLNLGFTVSH